jgi:hypothetical protein
VIQCARFRGCGTDEIFFQEVNMFRLSQFAAPVVLGAAMIVGAGCAGQEHPQNIPLNAREIGEAKEMVSYTAPDDGTIYVQDATAHKLIYSGQVKKGQMVSVNAKENQVMVDNQLATKTDLLNDHKYALYFQPSSEAEKAQTSGQHINIQTEPQSSNAQGATITTPGGTRITTPNNATVTVPPAQENNTTVTVPASPPPAENNSNQSGTSVTVPPTNSGGTTVTTPNGTVVKEHQQ